MIYLLHELMDEDDSPAAKQAKAMGLTSKGFGRWADSSGTVTHTTKNGQLVPVKGGGIPVGGTDTKKVQQVSPDDFWKGAQGHKPGPSTTITTTNEPWGTSQQQHTPGKGTLGKSHITKQGRAAYDKDVVAKAKAASDRFAAQHKRDQEIGRLVSRYARPSQRDKAKQLGRLLQGHDWYYEYSDDHSQWRKGVRQRSEIRDFIDQSGLDPHTVEKMWNHFAPDMYKMGSDPEVVAARDKAFQDAQPKSTETPAERDARQAAAKEKGIQYFKDKRAKMKAAGKKIRVKAPGVDKDEPGLDYMKSLEPGSQISWVDDSGQTQTGTVAEKPNIYHNQPADMNQSSIISLQGTMDRVSPSQVIDPNTKKPFGSAFVDVEPDDPRLDPQADRLVDAPAEQPQEKPDWEGARAATFTEPTTRGGKEFAPGVEYAAGLKKGTEVEFLGRDGRFKRGRIVSKSARNNQGTYDMDLGIRPDGETIHRVPAKHLANPDAEGRQADQQAQQAAAQDAMEKGLDPEVGENPGYDQAEWDRQQQIAKKAMRTGKFPSKKELGPQGTDEPIGGRTKADEPGFDIDKDRLDGTEKVLRGLVKKGQPGAKEKLARFLAYRRKAGK